MTDAMKTKYVCNNYHPPMPWELQLGDPLADAANTLCAGLPTFGTCSTSIWLVWTLPRDNDGCSSVPLKLRTGGVYNGAQGPFETTVPELS